MKSYTDFLNESKERKFNTGDSVKRKKDGAISKIIDINHHYHNSGFAPALYYEINFGDGDKKYRASELEIPTEFDIDVNKYNI